MARKVDWENRKLTWSYDIIPLTMILLIMVGFVAFCIYFQGRIDFQQVCLVMIACGFINIIRGKIIEHVEGEEDK